MQEKNRSLFDLLLDETYPWETLHEEHKTSPSRPWHDSSSKPLEALSRRERVMNDASKVKPSHIQRAAFVYIRQSSPAQVEYHRESTARQYALVEKACQLGWAKEQVIVIDEDLGVSGSGFAERSGFARMTAEVSAPCRAHQRKGRREAALSNELSPAIAQPQPPLLSVPLRPGSSLRSCSTQTPCWYRYPRKHPHTDAGCHRHALQTP